LDDFTISYFYFHFSLIKEKQLNPQLIKFMLIYENSDEIQKLNELKNYCQRYELLEQSHRLRPRNIIKSYHFIGRKEELNKLYQIANSTNNKFKVISIIADAGIGKTTLTNKFLEEYLKEREDIIKLYMYCSLTQSELIPISRSILEEANRIAKKSIIKSSILKINQALKNPKNLIKIIGFDIFKIIEGVKVMMERERTFQIIIDEKKQKPIEKIIEEFIKHIITLISLVKGEFVILVIDDLHWIDEDGAMFIEDLYETLKRRNKGLLIISSIRKAEFEKRRKLLREDEFFVKKLFEYVENGEKIYLKGFDKDLLSELIEIATNIKDERIQIISEEIINYLSKEKEANTLFAIETFNLISDENFSQKYKTIKIFEKGKLNENINKENIREIFEKLKEAHKKSYAEIKGEFDLPSFAVLESRLDFLKDEKVMGNLQKNYYYFLH